jgi:SagB-type dehydrogenase family enzyme
MSLSFTVPCRWCDTVGVDDRGGPEALYRSTMHGDEPAHPEALLAFRPLDPGNRPEPFKRYDAPARPLPRELRRSPLAAADVLSGQTGEPSFLDDSLLGTLLFLAGGVTRVAYSTGDQPTWFRASMSAGNLHPVEIYLVRDGVHHYQPLEHALVPLRRPVAPTDTGDSGRATLVLTGIPFRTCWKYGERGWRHLWWDAGCVLANLLAGAGAHGVASRVEVAFADEKVAELIGIDGVDEAPLALVHLGPQVAGLPSTDLMTPLTATAQPVARHVLRFPLVVQAQAGSSLGQDEVADWRTAAARVSRPVPGRVGPPPNADRSDRVEDVILRRGSTRVFRPEMAPLELLSWGLAAATTSSPFDTAPEGTLLEHYVNVHGIPGLAPGGYVYGGGTSYEGRTRSDDARAYGARLCLDQPLGGDSAYTVFHAAPLDPLVATLGGRAFRAALLEAGLIAGRLGLNATAVGGGATGLTFYDGLVGRYFRTPASPLLATAVGVPATRPAPSGSPGSPAELHGYSQVMARLTARLRSP